MVSLSFGEKINTDRIVSDKTAKEGIEELYPEAVKNNPGFLGENCQARMSVLKMLALLKTVDGRSC